MRSLSPARLLSVLLIAGIGACAFASAPAAAAGTPAVSTVTDTKVVGGPLGSVAALILRCPRGTEVLSGGYDSIFNGSAMLAHVSKRTGPRTWRVSAYKVGDGKRPVRMTAYARCGDPPSPIRQSSMTITVPPPPGHIALRTARPRCPAGSFPLSGGFEITINGQSGPNSPPAAIVLGSRADGRSWAVTAVRLASQGNSTLTAHSYCTSRRPFKRGISGIFPAKRHVKPHHLTALCPRGMSTASGGFLAHFPMGAAAGVMIPVSSYPVGNRRWTSTGVPQNSRSFYSAYAYCI